MTTNGVLTAWNRREAKDAVAELLPCCGSRTWANAMAEARPITTEEKVFESADAVWWSLSEADWMKAFACHLRIGDKIGERSAVAPSVLPSTQFDSWSRQEQSLVQQADENVRRAIAEGNRRYEQQFGFTYIVCATGKGAPQLLAILERRLRNDRAAEVREAAEQQRQITRIRLSKWLASGNATEKMR